MRSRTMIVLLLAAAAAVLLLGCSAKAPAPEESSLQSTDAAAESTPAAEEDGMLSLTLEELSQYNGQNGMPAYVAIDGVIYDMSLIKPWAGGKHNGHIAGTDLTEELKTRSPHGVRVLELLPKVGTVKE